MKKVAKKLAAFLLGISLLGSSSVVPVSAANRGWQQNSNGWRYAISNNRYENSGWSRINGVWYYFNTNGYMRTGWVRDNGQWYYLGGNGAMRTGWVRDNGQWYYLDGNGAMRTGWVRDRGSWYYLNQNGAMAADTLLQLGENMYYLTATGAMFIGTTVYNGASLTFGPDGAMIPENSSSDSENDTLVVYYSATGSTKRVAEYIASAVDGDLFEITPVIPYSSSDLDWTVSGSRVNHEHENEALRDIPLVSTKAPNWDDYDTVFIGYPIWWGIAAWPIDNFVEDNDFTGKTVIPFATSASSGMGQSGSLLADMAGTGNWQNGQRFSSGASASDVQAWVNGLLSK